MPRLLSSFANLLGQNFAKRDLPKVCRVVPPGHMMTRDYVPNRMNVHVGEDETVHNVTFG